MKKWNYENEQWKKLPFHLKHLPIFTRHIDFTSIFISFLWSLFLRFAFTFYARLKVIGDYHKIYKEHPKLLLISNHSSHIDATSIAASVPFRYWRDLYISAAKDYWFRNSLFSFFSKHCLGAIPIDRRNGAEAVQLCLTLLNQLDRIWLILFPEGTRSPDGYLQSFKKGVSVFSQATNTPVLFIYIKGNATLWPKGRLFPRPGSLRVYLGPVHPPADIDTIREAYKNWVLEIDKSAISEQEQPQK